MLLRGAAELREDLFRRERRQVDALEAIELFGMIEKFPAHACAAGLQRALLDGELRREPAALYMALYALKLRYDDAACEVRAERALRGLAAFRPLPSVLAELEREVGGEARAAAAAPLVSSSPNPAASGGAFVSPPTVPSGAATVTRIERYGSADAARVVVFLTRPARFEVGQVIDGSGQRFYVDVDAATYQGPSQYEVGGLVQRVRVGARQNGTRVVLDLEGPIEPRVFYLPEPFRLVIDVLARESDARRGSVASRSVRRVVLDPGHGGNDPGATGKNGLREKDVTLDIAHRAAPVIARELGITTMLTRDGDHYVALDERTARANAFHADLFVSIHCNASEDGVAKGVMTFVLDRGREEVAQKLAARENAASAAAGAELANALARVADPAHRGASLHFAELLQRAATASLAESYPDIPNGGVKRAGFYVLAGARMPAVLFETSFISNSSGETRLNTGDFRQKMADAIVNAIRAYREGR